MKTLFYTGPSLEVLHEQYAKHGRIDPEATVHAAAEVVVHSPADVVWQVLTDPDCWQQSDPAIREVRFTCGVRPDAPFHWRNGRTRVVSRFAVVRPHEELTWTGVAAGARAVHRHVLTGTAVGVTRLRTEESMAGPLLTLFYSSAKLETVLTRWVDGIRSLAEQRAADERARPH
ncbi:SRPBCC family protein [Nonomuraea rubra]|uniref:SRPBCC family protein n=1 Tax=Nonomuraea rubra TaxID=46180 RepID=UPI0033D85C64